MKAPAYAEVHTLSDYLREAPRVKSRYVPGVMLRSQEFVCPACNAVQPEPEHDHRNGCVGCALKWVAYGNLLYVWK